MSRKLVAFDFDGTLSYCDSFLPFLRFHLGRARFYALMLVLLPDFARYAQKKLDAHAFKEIVLARCFQGQPLDKVTRSAESFAEKILPRLINPRALKALEAHRQSQDQIVVISASPEIYLAPWAKTQGCALLGTKLLSEGGLLTGRIDGKNCRGPEKTRRLARYLERPNQLPDVAYGDSDGDRELLRAAREAHYKPFRALFFTLKSKLLLLRHCI